MREINAGTMHGFQITNIFPDVTTEEDWTEFADTMSKILKTTDDKNEVA